MRKVALLLILLIPCVLADNVQYAEIRFEVINRPPRITKLSFIPEDPYYDAILKCSPEIDDESPDTVSYFYSWYVNGNLVKQNSAFLADFSDNDIIRCESTPVDKHGEMGETKIIEVRILPSPVRVKFLKPVLNTVGVDVSAKELGVSTSMSAVTGMVTGQGGSSITVFFFLAILLLIILALNLTGLLIRKIRSPTQDSSLS